MVSNSRYIDFDLNFTAHPVTGDISMVKDANAVIQSIKNLVQLKPSEIPFEPRKGSKVTAFLFENISPMTAISLQDEIKILITNHEPRAEVIEVSVYANPDQNGYQVVVFFNVVNIPDVIQLEFFLERLR